MAGIGFAIQRLTRGDDLLGVIQAYTHSAVASSGPWLFTILCLASITILTAPVIGAVEFATFRTVIMYNFALSLPLSGPIVMVATRRLADMIYEKNVDNALGMLVGSLILAFSTQMLIIIPFYVFVVDLPASTCIAAITNYFLVTSLWLVSVFLTALKVYRAVSGSFLVGLAVAFGLTVLLAPLASTDGMLFGFSAGLAIILFSLFARICGEYPYRVTSPFDVLAHFGFYWSLALSGFIYNAAIWADKFVMWFAPERDELPSGMIYNTTYDSAMFLAFLTIVPSMAVFVLNLETRFYERYRKFYEDIQNHADFDRIEENHRLIITELSVGFRDLIVLQGTIAFVVIMLAPQFFELTGLTFLEIGVFRFGVLGALFHVLVLSLTIVLSYFDLRRQVLGLNLMFLIANAAFTFAFMRLGFPYYGLGYFLAALLTFLAAALVTIHQVRQIPYLTFVHNPSANRPAREPNPMRAGI